MRIFFYATVLMTPLALLGQFVTPGPTPLVPLPAATFCGTGIPNTEVAVRTIVDGANTITLGLSAAQRFSNPAVTPDAPSGTYVASLGAHLPPPVETDTNLARWNFNVFATALNGTASAMAAYQFELLYDMDPNATQIPQMGVIRLGNTPTPGSVDCPTPVANAIQGSQNLDFNFLRGTFPGTPGITPPAGYQNPGGVDFDPTIPGQYSFQLRVRRVSDGQLLPDVVAINVSTMGRRIPNPEYSYQIRYVSNLNLGDGVINLTNDGSLGAGMAAGTSASTTGALCANVYAFAPDEQLISCCSCPVTPNGLVALSARRDIISNTFTPAVPTSIVVKLVATSPISGSCSNSATQARPATIDRQPGELVSGLRAWGTSSKAPLAPGGTVDIVETAFLPARLTVTTTTQNPFDVGELARMTGLCTMIQANGSGFGICASCQLGGLGGIRR